MSKKLFFLSFLLFCTVHRAFCQTSHISNVDTATIKLVIGYWVLTDPATHFTENGKLKFVVPPDGMYDYVNNGLEYSFLGREVASGLVFFRVYDKGTRLCFTVSVRPSSGWVCRLKGFHNHDLASFFSYVKSMGGLKSLLSGSHGIKEIDFRCLYRAKKSQTITGQKYPCFLHSSPCIPTIY